MLNIIVNALMRSRTDRLFSESCQRCEAVLTERYNVSPLSRHAETAVSADVFPTLQGNTLLDVAECGSYPNKSGIVEVWLSSLDRGEGFYFFVREIIR